MKIRPSENQKWTLDDVLRGLGPTKALLWRPDLREWHSIDRPKEHDREAHGKNAGV